MSGTLSRPLNQSRVLLSHHWPLSRQRPQMFSADEYYLTRDPDAVHPRAVQMPPAQEFDMADALARLPAGWEPEVFIAKVDGYFYFTPRNLAALRCPKILILGDTQHGPASLSMLLRYIQAEPYDIYITDHKRHHLWYFHEAGLRELYWLPGLISLKPPAKDFLQQPFQQAELNQLDWSNATNLIGQIGDMHPRRQRVAEALRAHGLEAFHVGGLPQQDSLKAYALSQASLNISLNGDLNCRVLEIIAAGGLLFSDRLSEAAGLELLLEDGKDYVGFSSIDELWEKLQFYKQNPALAQACRESGAQRYQNEYRPELMQLQLERIINQQAVEPRYSLQSLVRLRHCQGKTPLSWERLRLYEVVQELHRQWEQVSLVLDMRLGMIAAEDFLDLPRLQLCLLQSQQRNLSAFRSYLQASGQQARVHFSEHEIPGDCNVLVIAQCSTNLLAHLVNQRLVLISNDVQGWESCLAADQRWQPYWRNLGSGWFMIDFTQ